MSDKNKNKYSTNNPPRYKFYHPYRSQERENNPTKKVFHFYNYSETDSIAKKL